MIDLSWAENPGNVMLCGWCAQSKLVTVEDSGEAHGSICHHCDTGCLRQECSTCTLVARKPTPTMFTI